MTAKTSKYLYYLALVISVLAFCIFIIVNYFLIIINPSFQIKILIFLFASLFLGMIVTFGISIVNPILSEAITTLRRMIRVESLSNPLLVKLSSQAPGTYHHSLNVSTLAQKAAKAINADSLLVRTAAYYHDIGKLENPLIYIENQSGREVPTTYDAISIRSHAKAIISHVAKGVEIAKKSKLPEKVIELVQEHHGTTRALYFYGIAKEKGLKIKKTDFRYNGPNPGSKESAILMLSDCVEASARATDNLTINKIREIVEKTINERVSDDQFKNSGLSINELDLVKKSLEETLHSIYHLRIKYNLENESKNDKTKFSQ